MGKIGIHLMIFQELNRRPDKFYFDKVNQNL
jgi:hypothetical protein